MKNNVFGKNLKYYRLQAKLTQRQLAKQINVSNQAVSFWEQGSREPDLDTIVEITKFFNITFEDLLSE